MFAFDKDIEMGWLKRWASLRGTSGEVEEDFDKPIDPIDTDEVSVLIKVKFCDGRDNEKIVRTPCNQIPVLVQELIDLEDVKECWVYEEVAYHHKTDAELPSSTVIALGLAFGATMGGSIR